LLFHPECFIIGSDPHRKHIFTGSAPTHK
jgi:hypothetical protein